MKKLLSILLIIFTLCTPVSTISVSNEGGENIIQSSSISTTHQNKFTHLPELFSRYSTPDQTKVVTSVQLPWITQQSNLLEWYIQLRYNDQIFQKKVPVSVADFDEKFLKHPEYGEKMVFDVDADPEDDIEVIASFYWSIITDQNGKDVKSLEKRIRVRQLASGDYIAEQNAELQVWSELHVNYGLIKKATSVYSIMDIFKQKLDLFPTIFNILDKFINITNLHDRFKSIFSIKENNLFSQQNDADHIAVGTGYLSPAGEDIPRYAEKRFAIARDNLFSPTLFQHQMDPGSAKGKGPFDLLYGFKAFKEGSSNPSYDINFLIEFNPAVSLKTKFVPVNGLIYYYFDDSSQQDSSTNITFVSNALAGKAEDVELTLTFNEIDETLGRIGRWMKFDVDLLGDNNVLGGKFQYEASHVFDVGILVSSPLFEEKIELFQIPKTIDVSWDLDFLVKPTPLFFAHAEGFINLSMSSSIGEIKVYYPKTNPEDHDQIFLNVPKGLPENIRIDAATTLNIDLTNLQNSQNYIYGNIKHTCNANIDCVRAFLPEDPISEQSPVVNITQIPALSEAKGKLYWNTLQGNAYIFRGSHGDPDPVEINLGYKDYSLHNILTIRDGYIDTKFKLADQGNFYFDTTKSIFGNELSVSNAESGDSLELSVNEVSADKLHAEWNLDTTGDSLKIQHIDFSGMIDVMDALQLNLNYQGKATSASLNWNIGQSGNFEIHMEQEEDVTLDFSDFAINSTDFDLDGEITLSDTIIFDMCWDLKQGTGSSNESVEPGFFAINKNNVEGVIKNFHFFISYQDQYGINISFCNLQFYLNFEWWKGDRLLPYIWLDYEVSSDEFDVDLLWTNGNGETLWYNNMEEW